MLWPMWCPGISDLLTRLIFQRNWRRQGFGWDKAKYQLASYWIPLAYASAVYLPAWFAGYCDAQSQVLAHMAERFPTLPHWFSDRDVFRVHFYCGIRFLVHIGAWRRARLPRIYGAATEQASSISCCRPDQRYHLGAVALFPHPVFFVSGSGTPLAFPLVFYGDGDRYGVPVCVDAAKVGKRLDRYVLARWSQYLHSELFRRADAAFASYGFVDDSATSNGWRGK